MSYEAFAYYYDSLMDQNFYNDYIQFINEHVKDYQTVLELGCGTGEIAIRLAHLGKQVCATDISKDMLEVAKYKCIDFKVDVMLSRIDMCDFAVDSQLDLILCLCDSLNYVIDLKNVKQVFENTYNALKKGGSFIFDIDSMYKMETILKDYDEENDEDDFYFHWHVDRISKGYVKHSVEIIDKVENDRVYEEHYQKTYDVETYIELVLKTLSYIVIFLNMILNVKELYLYVKRGDFMIGIIGAMEEEVKALLDKTEDIHENKILDCVFYEGKIDNKQVVILQGGIGKVNSAICVTLLLTNYDIDYVINIGSAGGLKDYQNIGDVVISSHVAYHDVDLTAFGRPMGELPELPVFIPADENLVNKAKDILHKMNIHENVGLIVSGDQFIAQEGQVSKIKKDFPNALCSEMEASAIGHTCYKFGVPFIITRSLSDVYGHGESSMQFDEYLKIASENSAKLCVELVKA